MSQRSSPELRRLQARTAASTRAANRSNRFFGRLTSGDYGSLLRDLRAARSSREELAREMSRQTSKAASLLDTYGACWWAFYELSYAKHIWLICHHFGWAEKIKEIAAAENPSRAFLAFAADDSDSESSPFVGMEAPIQAGVLNLLFGLLYSIDATRLYGLSMNELIAKANAGDVEAFYRAASVDRTVVLTQTGAGLLASAQLRGDQKFFVSLLKRSKPHDGREYYGDLRYVGRVLDETKALETCSGDELLTLVGDELCLYSTKSGDPVKGLLDRLRDWKRDATR